MWIMVNSIWSWSWVYLYSRDYKVIYRRVLVAEYVKWMEDVVGGGGLSTQACRCLL